MLREASCPRNKNKLLFKKKKEEEQKKRNLINLR